MAGKPGRSGRHRKPTAVLKLTGNFRPGRHADRAAEPKPPRPKSLRPPSWLSAEGRKHWTEFARPLHEAGILTVLDVPAVGVMAEEWAAYLTALEQAELAASPAEHRAWRRTASQALANWQRLASELGLVPSGRAKLHIAEPKKDDPRMTAYDKALARGASNAEINAILWGTKSHGKRLG